jgi:hypothetical protein
MHDLILLEILALPAERSRGRHNPRVVKRKMSGFPTKARAAPGPPPGRRFQYGDHIRIVAPVLAEADPTRAAPKCRRACQPRADRHAFWLEHVSSWRASGLSRADYAERHGLKLPALHQWIARLRHIFHKRGKAHTSHS